MKQGLKFKLAGGQPAGILQEIYGLLTKGEVKIAGYWPSPFLCLYCGHIPEQAV